LLSNLVIQKTWLKLERKKFIQIINSNHLIEASNFLKHKMSALFLSKTYIGFFSIYIIILITTLHRYREDIDTTIYNMHNIYSIVHRKTVSQENTPFFMTCIKLHRLVRFNLFFDTIIPKKLIIFGLFVCL
jgi:hypothetical protein